MERAADHRMAWFRTNLERYMEANECRPVDLAARSGVSLSVIVKWLTDLKRKHPSADKVQAVAAALGVSGEDLFRDPRAKVLSPDERSEEQLEARLLALPAGKRTRLIARVLSLGSSTSSGSSTPRPKGRGRGGRAR